MGVVLAKFRRGTARGWPLCHITLWLQRDLNTWYFMRMNYSAWDLSSCLSSHVMYSGFVSRTTEANTITIVWYKYNNMKTSNPTFYNNTVLQRLKTTTIDWQVKKKCSPKQNVNLTIDLVSRCIYDPGPQVLTNRPPILRRVWIWTPFPVPGPERRVKWFLCFRIGRR